jgi:murein DD-endopeptidase MepM/ murein hydrolase activator NlpD
MKLADKVFRRTGWYLTSAFGPRKDPISGERKQHNGTDYGTGGQKWPLYAIEDGQVLRCGTDPGAGRFVWVDYPRFKRKLFLCHLDSIAVRPGQMVKEGTLLGYTGTTGRSTGIHLHLAMQPSAGGAWEDPHAYKHTPVLDKPVQGLTEALQIGDRVRIKTNALHYYPGGSRVPNWLKGEIKTVDQVLRAGRAEVRGGEQCVLLEADGLNSWMSIKNVDKVKE